MNAIRRGLHQVDPRDSIQRNTAIYKVRAAVERFFGWLKLGFRRISIRHERIDACFMGFLQLTGFLMIWRRIWNFETTFFKNKRQNP